MRRGLKLTALIICVAGSAALSGCSESIYPRLPNLGGIGSTLLTPTEQEKAIKDLTAEQKAHSAEAAEEIEGRN
jgi:hypothetical protein